MMTSLLGLILLGGSSPDAEGADEMRAESGPDGSYGPLDEIIKRLAATEKAIDGRPV